MLRTLGGLILLIAAVVIFLAARKYPFTGIVDLQFNELWLWLVLAIAVLFAGLGGYLVFMRRHIEL